MSDDLAITLGNCMVKGYVIAPAGYGKTHLIAMAVKAASKRQLVLTHTFAGVNSIKAKMAALKVPAALYQIDTIASWSLKLCLAYPKGSGWNIDAPSSKQWDKLYESCTGLLTNAFIRHIILCSYAGVYVDEYQDCSDLQHTLVCRLADILPCRVLGDPMQAIFDFDNGQKPVDWDVSIYPYFECLGKLETPWRWENAGAHLLGAWLKKSRERLENGLKLDLVNDVPFSVKRIYADPDFLPQKQHTSLMKLFASDGSVIALHGGDQRFKEKTHALARMLSGKFSSIEEVEGRALHSIIKKLESSKNSKVAFLHALDFAKKCFTGVNNALTAGTKKGEVANQIKTTKYPVMLKAANLYLGDPKTKNLIAFFLELMKNPETSPYRRDLFYRFLHVLKMHIDGEGDTLIESANLYQRDMRHSGRPIRHTKLIGTTLLVKGLEYDHVIILDADSLDAKDLYVAMTRGAKSLTIIYTGNPLPA
ncbi:MULTISPECIES: UvrD-helicase domain-containing protein [unclassified Janthinobacterium]|uniref:UvrD-helicase domain-containing protein n=1 Tax=unclassified Janthinobacterium TaxID=2610881 RepID=UPI0008752ADD|nr:MULTISPECIES: UvrD-helicase domain-containing protein [unclassified Janthinobacterium]